MKKILFLTCIVLLSSCNSGVSTEVNQEAGNSELVESEANVSDTSGESVGDVIAKIQNIPNIYMEDENFKYCMAQNIDACISDFKFQNPDITSCDDFLTSGGVEMCKVTEVTAQARQEESMDVCDTLATGAESCKNEVAVAIGIKSGKVDTCEGLDESYITECKNQILLSNAIVNRDSAICDTLIVSEDSMTFEKDFCKQEVEMQIENDAFEKQQQEEQERMQAEMEAELEEQARIQAEMDAQMEADIANQQEVVEEITQ